MKWIDTTDLKNWASRRDCQEYLPEGLSRWEVETNQEIKRKAEKDYQKRKTDTLRANPTETTFIFVTPRI